MSYTFGSNHSGIPLDTGNLHVFTSGEDEVKKLFSSLGSSEKKEQIKSFTISELKDELERRREEEKSSWERCDAFFQSDEFTKIQQLCDDDFERFLNTKQVPFRKFKSLLGYLKTQEEKFKKAIKMMEEYGQ